MIPPTAPAITPAPAPAHSPAHTVETRGGKGEVVAFPTVLLALASFGTQTAAAATPALPGGDGPGGAAEHADVDREAIVSCEAGCAPTGEIAALVAEAMAVWGGDSPESDVGDAMDSDAGVEAPAPPAGVAPNPATHGIETIFFVGAPAVAPVSDRMVELDASTVQLPQEAPQAADTVTLDARMLRRLSRDFVPRLRRVAERMWNEHGMRVQIVEGYRSQNRQDALFAQGRTTDGPVVTWTRSSLHTSGAAADVYLDGAPVTPQQARILARVAAEEGLRTLYPYDSGHIQMESARTLEGPDMPGDRGLPAPAPGAPGRRPGVAPVAPVARPARPARPGGAEDGADAPELRPDPARPTVRGPDSPRPAGAAESERSILPKPEGEATERRAARPEAPSRASPQPTATTGSEPTPVLASAAPAGAPAGASRPAPAAEDGGAVAPPLPPDPPEAQQLVYRRVRLPIEGVAGRASLDLGVRPGSIDAQLNVSDPRLADDLQRGLHELRQLLAERGVETRGLSVRLTPQGAGEVQSADGTAALRATADGSAGQSSAGSGRGGGHKTAHPFDRREDPSQPGRQHRSQEDPDGPDS